MDAVNRAGLALMLFGIALLVVSEPSWYWGLAIGAMLFGTLVLMGDW